MARLHDRMAWHVDTGRVPGLISLVARNGEPQVDVIGSRRLGDSTPLPRDAIFRIASLTKPIAAAAAMILVDDAVLRLDDPVERLLPELADRRVLRSIDAELDDTVPAERAITLEDLLTFRLGFGQTMAPPGTYPIQRAEADLQLRTLGPPWPPSPHDPDTWIRHFGSLPLLHQPGAAWMYNTGSQVLGVLIERATGRPVQSFLDERLFGPLGMTSTGFSVPPDQLHRFTTAYAPDPAGERLDVLDDADDSWWATPPPMANLSGWAVSTIDDFWSFVAMLLGRGMHRGTRILSERSVELMTSNHVPAAQRAAAAPFLSDRVGWGFCMAASIPHEADGGNDPLVSGEPNGFGWTGGTGTAWYSDPVTGLTGVLFTQRAMTSPQPPEVFTDFWRLAYAALDG